MFALTLYHVEANRMIRARIRAGHYIAAYGRSAQLAGLLSKRARNAFLILELEES